MGCQPGEPESFIAMDFFCDKRNIWTLLSPRSRQAASQGMLFWIIKWAVFSFCSAECFPERGSKEDTSALCQRSCSWQQLWSIVLSVLHYLLLFGDLSAWILLRNVCCPGTWARCCPSWGYPLGFLAACLLPWRCIARQQIYCPVECLLRLLVLGGCLHFLLSFYW